MIPRRWFATGVLALCAWAVSIFAAHDAAWGSNCKSRLWRLAELEQAEMAQRGLILQDAALSAFLQRVADRLWSQVTTTLGAPTLQVVKDTRIAAYVYPNGHCFFTTGILCRVENEDQLAMILAHEMVHYLRQDTLELYDYFQRPFSDVGPMFEGPDHSAHARTLERKLNAAEYRADAQGLSMMLKAGYCGTEVLTFMAGLIADLQDQAPSAELGLLAVRKKKIATLLQQVHRHDVCASTVAGGQERFLRAMAPALMANGRVALQRGDWETADRSISRYLELAPDDVQAYYLKGEILRRQGVGQSKEPSIDYFQQALGLDPTFPPAYRALGELHFKAGRYRMAGFYFDAFLRLEPQSDSKKFIMEYLRQCRDREAND